jgi:hypothetical protein
MRKICLVLFTLNMLLSCSKKEADSIIPTKENLAGSYKTQKITAMYSGTGFEINITNTILPDSCDRDDILKINTDNTVNYIDAGMVCTPPNDRSSTWNLTSNSTFDLDSDSYTIRKWDGVNMEATFPVNSSATGVIYMKKQ